MSGRRRGRFRDLVNLSGEVIGSMGESLRGWRGARNTRIDSQRGSTGRADWQNEGGYDRRDMVDNARRLVRENGVAEGMLARSVENVVGTGWPLQALSGNPRWNSKAETAWKLWGQQQADIRGLATFDQLLQLHQAAKLRDGDSFCLLVNEGKIGTLQAIESDQVATVTGLQKKLIDGVELDSRGKPIAYHVVTSPDPRWTSVREQPSKRIAADFIVPLRRVNRHGETRGTSAFANSFWPLEQLDGHVKASTVAARMAACVGLVLHNNARMAALAKSKDGDGLERRKLRMEPGFILERLGDEKVTQVDPSKPTQSLPETVRLLALMAGIPFGLPIEVSLMYWADSNMSQARGALLQAYNVWQQEQADLETFASRIYNWWVIRAMEAGVLPTRLDALGHRWLKPSWRYLNPKEELLADLARVDANLGTLGEITRRGGHELTDVIAVRAEEKRMVEAAGLDQARSTITRDPVEPGSAPPPSGEDPDA